jgi:DNA-binding NarL/FixJ family response regulator
MHRKTIVVLIADDHTLVAEAFKKLLDTDYEVVGTVRDRTRCGRHYVLEDDAFGLAYTVSVRMHQVWPGCAK